MSRVRNGSLWDSRVRAVGNARRTVSNRHGHGCGGGLSGGAINGGIFLRSHESGSKNGENGCELHLEYLKGCKKLLLQIKNKKEQIVAILVRGILRQLESSNLVFFCGCGRLSFCFR